jgi:hypothetical protein
VSHRTRFVLAQHYFRVPVNHVEWDNYNLYGTASVPGMNGVAPPPLRPSSSSSSSTSTSSSSTSTSTTLSTPGQIAQDDALMHLWYVSTPFEVVRVFDAISEEDDEDGGTPDRPRPLVAVDFGHAVWIEYVEGGDVDREEGGEGEEGELKWLRFVTFPAFRDEWECERDLRAGVSGQGGRGEVRTLEVPEELDLSAVETINIDQSQGAVILSDRDGRIFILCYE